MMTASANDRLFGDIAVRKGYLSADLLQKALNYQQTLTAPQPLGQILIVKGVMSPAQVQDCVTAQRRASGPYNIAQNPNPMAPATPQPMPQQGHGNPPTPPHGHYSPGRMQPPNSKRYQQPTASGGYQPATPMQRTSPPQKPKRPIPPGVDPSVIDDDGEVDIIGRTIGGCYVTKKIGQGGMGSIFLAQHSNLNRQVVIKILPPKAAMTKKNLDRFKREARAAAKLEHPNIVQVMNVDKSPEGLHYIMMQYIDGIDLDKLVKERGVQTWQEATRIIFESSSGLKLAHDNGIIHRDIKAENIMLTHNGVTKVTDFGLAKDLSSDLKLTADGAFIGTPLYMAPEIGRVPQIDGRVDIFSLGVTYYFLLTGIQPFRGFKTMEILSARAHDKIKDPFKYVPDLPGDVRRILGKMLFKDRDKRYREMAELIADVQLLQAGIPVKAGPPPLWDEEDAPEEDAEPGPKTPTNNAMIGVIALGAMVIVGLVSIIFFMALKS
jgi:tRNA A-37 threonylcarbamoyl transferase component Bud32